MNFKIYSESMGSYSLGMLHFQEGTLEYPSGWIIRTWAASTSTQKHVLCSPYSSRYYLQYFTFVFIDWKAFWEIYFLFGKAAAPWSQAAYASIGASSGSLESYIFRKWIFQWWDIWLLVVCYCRLARFMEQESAFSDLGDAQAPTFITCIV